MSTVQSSAKRSRFQFSLRWTLVFVTVACVLFAWAGWYQRTVWEKRRCVGEIGAVLLTLPNRRPPEMTPQQWKNVVAWTTHNLFANSMPFTSPAELSELQRFERELKAKFAGEVDFNTILWIWDRFAELSPHGKKYNENCRKQMIEDCSPEGSKRAHWH